MTISYTDALRYARDKKVMLPEEFYLLDLNARQYATTVSYLASLDQIRTVINLANNQIDKVGNRAALLLEKTQLESVTEFAGVIVPQTYTQSTLFGTITAGGKPYSFSFPAAAFCTS